MKIESKGIEITDIPVFDSITVTPEEIILFGGDSLFNEERMMHHLFRVEALALRDALSAALGAQAKMPGASVETAPAIAPRVFERGSDEPAADVRAVRDRDDDIWPRVCGGWVAPYSDDIETWSYALQYAPLTEVRDA